MKRYFVLPLLCLSILCAALVQPALAAPTMEKSVIDQVLERGVLRVGFSSFVPWAMQNKAGEFVGFEIDVAQRLADDLGVKLQLAPTKWAGIIPALLSGKFDVVIGGLSVTPERLLKVNFTIPYDHAIIEMTQNKEKTAHIQNVADLDNPDIIVAVRSGTTAAIAAKTMLPKATFRYFDDEAPAVQEVLAGRAHVFFSSAPMPTFETLDAPDKLTQPFKVAIYPQPIAIAVRKGDVDTLNVFDNWIRLVEAEGWLEERRQYWFHSKDWESTVTQ